MGKCGSMAVGTRSQHVPGTNVTQAILPATPMSTRRTCSFHLPPQPGPERLAESQSAGGAVVTLSVPELALDKESNWHVTRADGDRVLLLKKAEPLRLYPIDSVRGE